MKVSIWQQFSSNHSNSYVVIGEFKSVADTENAATTMKQILKQIYDWYADETNKALADDVRNTQSHPPTPAENQIATQYNVTFDYAMDWIAVQPDADFIDDAIITLDNYLFVTATDLTTSTDTQFAQLIRKIGGELTYAQEMKVGLPFVNMTCTAPNSKAAEMIASSIRIYLHRGYDNFWQRSPWVLYYDGKLASQPEQISAEIEIFVEHKRAMREWDSQNKDELDRLSEEQKQALRNRDVENAEIMKSLFHEMREQRNNVQPKLEPDRELAIHEILIWTLTWADSLTDSNTVIVDANHVKITRLSLMYDVMGRTIKAIIAWLEAQGCENVLYQFEVIKYT